MGNEQQQSPWVTTHDYMILGILAFLLIGFLAVYIWLMFIYCWSKMRSRGDIESDYTRPVSTEEFRRIMDQLRDANSSTPAAAGGLSSAQIKLLKSFKYKKSPDESEVECSICLLVMADDEEVRRLPNCKHYFHKGCIDAWLSRKPTCPLCLTTVVVVGAAPQEQPQRDRIIFGPQQQPEQNVGIFAIV